MNRARGLLGPSHPAGCHLKVIFQCHPDRNGGLLDTVPDNYTSSLHDLNEVPTDPTKSDGQRVQPPKISFAERTTRCSEARVQGQPDTFLPATTIYKVPPIHGVRYAPVGQPYRHSTGQIGAPRASGARPQTSGTALFFLKYETLLCLRGWHVSLGMARPGSATALEANSAQVWV